MNKEHLTHLPHKQLTLQKKIRKKSAQYALTLLTPSSPRCALLCLFLLRSRRKYEERYYEEYHASHLLLLRVVLHLLRRTRGPRSVPPGDIPSLEFIAVTNRHHRGV